MRFAELLTEAEVRRTHEASLEVLEDVGILAHNAKAREVFRKHGCQRGRRDRSRQVPG